MPIIQDKSKKDLLHQELVYTHSYWRESLTRHSKIAGNKTTEETVWLTNDVRIIVYRNQVINIWLHNVHNNDKETKRDFTRV